MQNSDIAFVLHTRPYRETSQLVTFFSHHHGRFNAVGRAVRGGRNGTALRPFIPLQITWRGKTDLKSLISAEQFLPVTEISGELLFVGLYINELLMRILHENDAHERLFEKYQTLLVAIAGCPDLEFLLRVFEFNLLEEMGYGLQLEVTIDTGEVIQEHRFYRFLAGEGFIESGCSDNDKDLYPGSVLLSMAAGTLSDPLVRRLAKRLMRQALQPYLGNKPLRSRELFVKEKTSNVVAT